MAHLSLSGPFGALTVFEDGGALVALEWGRAPEGAETPLLRDARDQLNAYFDGTLTRFDLPLAPRGTSFQQAVWRALRAIPYGETCSYGALARALGTAPRSVGGACGRNPLPILVPCHRVVAASGGLAGYSADGGVAVKRHLLRLEGARIREKEPEPA